MHILHIDLKNRLGKLGIESIENCSLAAYTSFKIGGNASLAVFPKSMDDTIAVLSLICENNIKYLILGNGTNVLISDNGFDGVAVILSGMKGFSAKGNTIFAESGMSITHLAYEASKLSLSGLEFAFGIPGTVGGGIYMNAGAYGGEVSKVIKSSKYFDMKTGKTGTLFGDEHKFAYRSSAYLEGVSERIILGAEFELIKDDPQKIREAMDCYMSRRREKQPLDLPSAGSVFKRGNGFITSQLVEEAGLKGRTVGKAQVSTKHAGFIVNLGGATASDVLTLIQIIKEEILEKFGVNIECEIRYISE